MKFLLTLALAALGSQVCVAQNFIWTMTLQSVTVNLTQSTDSQEAVHFNYEYLGIMPVEDGNATLEFHIYESGCDTLYASDGDNAATPKSVYRYQFAENDPQDDDLTVKVALDLATISGVSEVWSESETEAVLSFCGRLEAYYGDGEDGRNKTFVTFHETDMNATISLLEDGGFDVTDIHYNLVQSDEDEQFDKLATVNYDMEVFLCNEGTHLPEGSGNQTVNQGDSVVFCIKVDDAVTEDSVYVKSVHEFRYWATNTDDTTPTAEVIAISNGNVNNLLTQTNCGVVDGVCSIKFIPDAALFADASDTAQDLEVGGDVVIAFGTDPDRRRLAVVNLRSLVVEGGEALSEYSYTIGPFGAYETSDSNLDAEDKPKGGLYVGIVVLLLALCGCAAFQYFFFFAKRRNQDENTKSLDSSTVDSPISTQASRRSGELMVDVNMA